MQEDVLKRCDVLVCTVARGTGCDRSSQTRAPSSHAAVCRHFNVVVIVVQSCTTSGHSSSDPRGTGATHRRATGPPHHPSGRQSVHTTGVHGLCSPFIVRRVSSDEVQSRIFPCRQSFKFHEYFDIVGLLSSRCTQWVAYTIFIHWSRSRGDNNTFGSVRPFVCLWALSYLNRLTFDLGFWHEGWSWPWLAWDCRSRSNSKNCLPLPFERVVRSRSILWLGLPSSANGNFEWPLQVYWNCLFVCGHSPIWTVWPLTLIFGMRVDLDLG